MRKEKEENAIEPLFYFVPLCHLYPSIANSPSSCSSLLECDTPAPLGVIAPPSPSSLPSASCSANLHSAPSPPPPLPPPPELTTANELVDRGPWRCNLDKALARPPGKDWPGACSISARAEGDPGSPRLRIKNGSPGPAAGGLKEDNRMGLVGEAEPGDRCCVSNEVRGPEAWAVAGPKAKSCFCGWALDG